MYQKYCRSFMQVNFYILPFPCGGGLNIFCGQGKVAGHTNPGIGVQDGRDILKDFVVSIRGFNKNLGLVMVMGEFFQPF